MKNSMDPFQTYENLLSSTCLNSQKVWRPEGRSYTRNDSRNPLSSKSYPVILDAPLKNHFINKSLPTLHSWDYLIPVERSICLESLAFPIEDKRSSESDNEIDWFQFLQEPSQPKKKIIEKRGKLESATTEGLIEFLFFRKDPSFLESLILVHPYFITSEKLFDLTSKIFFENIKSQPIDKKNEKLFPRFYEFVHTWFLLSPGDWTTKSPLLKALDNFMLETRMYITHTINPNNPSQNLFKNLVNEILASLELLKIKGSTNIIYPDILSKAKRRNELSSNPLNNSDLFLPHSSIDHEILKSGSSETQVSHDVFLENKIMSGTRGRRRSDRSLTNSDSLVADISPRRVYRTESDIKPKTISSESITRHRHREGGGGYGSQIRPKISDLSPPRSFVKTSPRLSPSCALPVFVLSYPQISNETSNSSPSPSPHSSFIQFMSSKFSRGDKNNKNSSPNTTPIKESPKAQIPETISIKMSTEQPISFLSLPLFEIASYITFRDHSLFTSIPLNEYRMCKWRKMPESILITMVDRFNSFSNWVTTEIIMTPNPTQRVTVLERFIKLIKKFKKLRNYNGMMATYSGLNSSSIQRLKKTWKSVSPKYLTVLELMEEEFDFMGNFGRYRTFLRTTSLPCLPFQGVWFSDLTSLEEVPTKLDDEMINWDKMKTVSKTLQDILTFQKVPYPQKEVIQMDSLFDNCLIVSDPDELWQKSVLIEPNSKEEGSKRKSLFFK